MEDIISELVVAIVTALISVVITWIKKEGYDNDFEDKYVKYKLIFDVSGQLIKGIDQKLYDEMEEAVTRMQTAYSSPEFTTKAFREIVSECADVFTRAQELISKRR